jgi:hypothetical protein
VEPTPLLPCRGKDLAQRTPEPERAVPDRQHRGGHAAAGAVTQQICPRLDRFAIAVGQRDELFATVRAHPDKHEQTQLVFLEADVDMDPIGPQVDVVHTG